MARHLFVLEEETPAGTIVRPDPKARAITVLALLALVVAAVGLNAWIRSTVSELLTLAGQSPEDAFVRAQILLRWGTGAVGVLSALTVGYFFLESKRALRAGVFPAPGTRVFHRTRVRTGAAARRRAIVLLVLSGSLLVGVIALEIAIWSLVEGYRPTG